MGAAHSLLRRYISAAVRALRATASARVRAVPAMTPPLCSGHCLVERYLDHFGVSAGLCCEPVEEAPLPVGLTVIVPFLGPARWAPRAQAPHRAQREARLADSDRSAGWRRC